MRLLISVVSIRSFSLRSNRLVRPPVAGRTNPLDRNESERIEIAEMKRRPRPATTRLLRSQCAHWLDARHGLRARTLMYRHWRYIRVDGPELVDACVERRYFPSPWCSCRRRRIGDGENQRQRFTKTKMIAMSMSMSRTTTFTLHVSQLLNLSNYVPSTPALPQPRALNQPNSFAVPFPASILPPHCSVHRCSARPRLAHRAGTNSHLKRPYRCQSHSLVHI